MASRMAGSLTGKTQSHQGKWYYCKAVWLFFIFSIAFAFRLCVCIRIRSHTALRLPFFAEIHCAAAGLTVWLGAIHAAIQPYGSVVHSSSPTARNPVSAWVVGCARSEALQPYGWDAEPYSPTGGKWSQTTSPPAIAVAGGPETWRLTRSERLEHDLAG